MPSRILGSLILLFTICSCLVSNATTNLVRIRELSGGTVYVFDPTNITIHPGDVIKWTNTVGNLHDSTHKATPMLWASPKLSATNANKAFLFTFTNAGFYPYFCNTHVLTHPEQTGLVSVVSIPIISLGSTHRRPDGSFEFIISGGSAGQTCFIDASSTVSNWTQILTTNFPNTTCPACPLIDFVDGVTNLDRRFYRARVP